MKTTKLFLSITLTFILGVFSYGQDTWKVDPYHSKITFTTVHNTIADVAGLFNEFDATIKASKPDFSDASFEVEINVASIDTEVKMRDDHLRSADFFEVETYPKMTFKSTGIRKGDGQNRYKLTGDLTIKGITRPITLDLWYRGTIQNDEGKSIAGFQALGTLNRADYNVGNDFPASLISKEVQLKVDGEFIKE